MPGLLLSLLAPFAHAGTVVEVGASALFDATAEGPLTYTKDARGHRLPDFSHVGYHGGASALPTVKVHQTLKPGDGDDTERIQQAIDAVGARRPDKRGHRGAVLLKAGVYRVGGVLNLPRGGVVLRGEGSGPDGTVIVATGYGNKKAKRTLITVGNRNRVKRNERTRQAVTDAYVPIGATTFEVASTQGYRKGDAILVHRPATAEWIRLIGCDRLKPRWGKDEHGKKVDQTKQWRPEGYHLDFERRITAIRGNRITIDAPIVQPMDAEYGGGAIYHYEAPDRVREVGIEDLRLVSEFAKPVKGNPYGDPRALTESEDHAWNAIKLNRNSENTWVRNVAGKYFGWSVVSASGRDTRTAANRSTGRWSVGAGWTCSSREAP